jgi:hypothetical protein
MLNGQQVLQHVLALDAVARARLHQDEVDVAQQIAGRHHHQDGKQERTQRVGGAPIRLPPD